MCLDKESQFAVSHLMYLVKFPKFSESQYPHLLIGASAMPGIVFSCYVSIVEGPGKGHYIFIFKTQQTKPYKMCISSIQQRGNGKSDFLATVLEFGPQNLFSSTAISRCLLSAIIDKRECQAPQKTHESFPHSQLPFLLPGIHCPCHYSSD
jgi:hypothetical protein